MGFLENKKPFPPSGYFPSKGRSSKFGNLIIMIIYPSQKFGEYKLLD